MELVLGRNLVLKEGLDLDTLVFPSSTSSVLISLYIQMMGVYSSSMVKFTIIGKYEIKIVAFHSVQKEMEKPF
jgi:hypothetical protein